MGKIIKYWPKEEVIKALQQLPKDKPINKKTLIEYAKQGLICESSLIPRKFGSIKNACEQAGVRCDALYGDEHIKHITQLNIKYTKEKLKEILLESYKKYGIMRPTDFILKIDKENDCDIRGAIKKYYGTIDKALIDCNIHYENYYWTNERIINTLRELHNKYGPLYPVQINDFRKKKLICGSKLIRDRFGSIHNAAKIAGFQFVEPKDKGHKFNGKKGKTETEILDNIEVQYGIKLLRQYRIDVDNYWFYVDAYDPINNVVYEIDENYHKYEKQQLLDKLKDIDITRVLKCQIIRIKNY